MMLSDVRMASLRALVQACPVVLLTLMSCSPPYEGARCGSIGQLTDPATLPLGPAAPITSRSLGQPAKYFNYTNELGCCITNPRFSGEDCGEVSCPAVIARTTAAPVNFDDDPCGPNLGSSSCTVFLEGSKVVGVYAFCAD
jgi:hypothetical protein